jgi:Leucine Rich repeat
LLLVIIPDLGFKNLTDKDLTAILLKLSCSTTRRERRPRKCRRLEGVAEILNQLPPPSPLVSFNVVGNAAIGDAGMKHLPLIPHSVTSLDVSDCGLTPRGVETLCDYMTSNSQIVRLGMWGNDIGDEGAKYIAAMLQENKTLQILYAGHSSIGLEGHRSIAKALWENDTLRDIDITVMKLAILMSMSFAFLAF